MVRSVRGCSTSSLWHRRWHRGPVAEYPSSLFYLRASRLARARPCRPPFATPPCPDPLPPWERGRDLCGRVQEFWPPAGCSVHLIERWCAPLLSKIWTGADRAWLSRRHRLLAEAEGARCSGGGQIGGRALSTAFGARGGVGSLRLKHVGQGEDLARETGSCGSAGVNRTAAALLVGQDVPGRIWRGMRQAGHQCDACASPDRA